MRRALLVLALAWSVMSITPAAGQDESDVTFEGEVAETVQTVPPLHATTIGRGAIRITLTPNMDGVLRAEVADVHVANYHVEYGTTVEYQLSGRQYYWPPVPIEDGSFALRIFFPAPAELPSFVDIEGEVVSSSELRGTVRSNHSPVGTNWGAAGPADTPPDADDILFDAYVEGGGRLSVALTEDRLSVTAFELQDLPLAPCLPGEALSVRAFYDSGVGLDRAGAYIRGVDDTYSVNLDVAEVDGSHASGTVSWSSRRWDCYVEVRWQTEPFPTPEPTVTAQPSPLAPPAATPTPTPVEEPSGLPATGGGRGSGAPLAGLATMIASLGVALAAFGRLRMRA